MSSSADTPWTRVAVAVSDGDDPFHHLAVESALMGVAVERRIPCLFFYVNRLCVVWGKHQNPWLECDLARAEAEGAQTVRRFSGGGTVAQDPGNLNFAIAMPREWHQPDRNMNILIGALRAIGVPASCHLRVELAADGFKFSGQSFSLRGRAALHHGTLLVASDLDRIRRLLAAPPADARTHAIRSIPSPMRNLSDIRPGLGMDELREALLRGFLDAWHRPEAERWTADDLRRLETAHDEARYRSWDWRFGETPDFRWSWNERGIAWSAEASAGVIRRLDSNPPGHAHPRWRPGDRLPGSGLPPLPDAGEGRPADRGFDIQAGSGRPQDASPGIHGAGGGADFGGDIESTHPVRYDHHGGWPGPRRTDGSERLGHGPGIQRGGGGGG